MGKSLFVAAALTLFSASAIIEPSYPSSPGGSLSSSQFAVTGMHPGNMVFSGDGTAQFNNSVGTNNSFQVGSSTNLGVNASASSSLPYGVSSIASLDIGASSVLKQVIGTSANNQLKKTAFISAHELATNGTEGANAMVDHQFGSSYAEYLEMDNHNPESVYRNEEEYERAKKDEYEMIYEHQMVDYFYGTDLYNSKGTIKGNFKTVETGSATTGGSMADWSADADAIAKAKYGSNYENSHNFASEYDYQAAFDAEYNRAYADAAARAQRTSESEVTVNGIGSDASITPAETSKFDVQIAVADQTTAINPVGNANGSAGLNLTTSSFANQSNASTASGFMQAFGGSTVNPSLTTIPSIPYCGAVSTGICWDRTTESDDDEIEIFSYPMTSDSEGNEYLGSIFGYDDSNMPISGESIQNPYY